MSLILKFKDGEEPSVTEMEKAIVDSIQEQDCTVRESEYAHRRDGGRIHVVLGAFNYKDTHVSYDILLDILPFIDGSSRAPEEREKACEVLGLQSIDANLRFVTTSDGELGLIFPICEMFHEPRGDEVEFMRAVYQGFCEKVSGIDHALLSYLPDRHDDFVIERLK